MHFYGTVILNDALNKLKDYKKSSYRLIQPVKYIYNALTVLLIVYWEAQVKYKPQESGLTSLLINNKFFLNGLNIKRTHCNVTFQVRFGHILYTYCAIYSSEIKVLETYGHFIYTYICWLGWLINYYFSGFQSTKNEQAH